MFLVYPEHIKYYQTHNFLSLSLVDGDFETKVFTIKPLKFMFSKIF